MPKTPVFSYYYDSTSRTARCDLLFRVAISENCVLTLMAFSLSPLIGALRGLRQAPPMLLILYRNTSYFRFVSVPAKLLALTDVFS